MLFRSDLSRIESGKSEIKFEDTDINALLREIGDIYQSDMKSEVKFVVEAPASELFVFTDRNRLKQIIFNLLSNAIKNTEKGSITLKAEEQPDYLKFSVTDTG